jgi:Sugar-specific transcriptional regulator TrmB.
VEQPEANKETTSSPGQVQTTTSSSSPDEPAPASEGATIRMSKEALKMMLFTLKSISDGKHTTAEVSSGLGISQRQAERYLNELIKRGCVFREQKKYFLTELGQKILQGRKE